MQIKNYDFKVNKFTHYFHGLSGMSYKTPHLKQHHCNNSWESKILQQMSSEYLLSTSAYQNWLLICGTGNKWHICKRVYMELSDSKMNYFEMLDWFPPLLEGEIIFKEQTFFFSFPLPCQTHAVCYTLSPDSLIHWLVISANFTERLLCQFGNLVSHDWWPTIISTTVKKENELWRNVLFTYIKG